MAEYVYDYKKQSSFPLEKVWAALHKTADLDLAGGAHLVERISDSEWTHSAGDANVITHNKATYDEQFHRVSVASRCSKKKQLDEAFLEAIQQEKGTLIKISFITRANPLVLLMVKLMGASMYGKMCDHIVSNIEALCAGQAAQSWSLNEMEDAARGRLNELGVKPENGAARKS